MAKKQKQIDSPPPIETDEKAIRRQWDILQLLARRTNGVTVAELAERYQVNLRTIRRDLELLQDFFGAFSYHNEAHGRRRYFINEVVLNFPVKLDQDELLALCIGRNLMKPLQGTAFWKGIESSFKKIETALDAETVRYAHTIAPCFYSYQSGMFNYKPKAKIINCLLEALNQSRVVNITYRSYGSNISKTYDIHPYQFVYFEGMLYLAGYSCKDQDNRFWKIDRFEAAKLMTNRFRKPVDFKIESMLSPGECPYSSQEKVVNAQVVFDPKVARLIREHPLKSFKKVVQQHNGALRVTMEVAQKEIFCRWLLRFGNAAKVISPASLRNYIKDEVEKIAELYRKESE